MRNGPVRMAPAVEVGELLCRLPRHGSEAALRESDRKQGDDGDVLWALSTHEVENDALLVSALSSLAAEIAWDTVLSSVDGTSPSEL